MLVVGLDISERKRSEERETLQRTILEKTVKGNSLAELLNDLCVHVEQIVPSSICTAMLLDKKTGVLNIVAAPQALGSACAILNGTVPGEFSGACGTAAYTGEPVIITDTEQDPRWDSIREAARPLGIKACWSIPIFSEGEKPLGTFAISHSDVRHPTKFDLQLLETASYLAGVAIQCTQGKQELRNSEERYRVLYEDNPTMYFTVSSEGTVLSVNQFGAQQLGYTVHELVGQPVLNVFFKADHSKVLEQMMQCMKNPENLGRWEVRKIRKDGRVLWVRETVKVVKLAHDQPVLLIVCEDITEQKHVEEMLHSSKEAIRELYEVTSSPITDFEHRIRSLLELGCRRFDLSVGVLTRQHQDTMVVQYAYPSNGFMKEGTVIPLCQSYCIHALTSPDPIMVEHAGASEWRTDPGYTTSGLESYLGTKVLVDDRSYGTLCFLGKEPHQGQFTEADQDFLMLMARWVKGELERKHAEDALRTLAETAATLTGKDFLRFLVETLAKCLNVKYAFLTECTDSTKQTLRTLAFWNGTAFGDNFEYGLAHTPCQGVIEGEVCFYPHSVQQHFPDDDDLKTLNVESYVGYPLFSKSGEILGHLVAMDTQGISEESAAIPIIKLFASRVAAELERNKAEIALRKSEGRLRQVIDLVPQLIFAKDQEGRFILCNEALAKVYGTTVQTLIGKSDADFAVSQEEMNKFRKDDLEVIESGKVKVIKEEQLTDISGELHYLHTTKIPFVFADTTLPSVLGVSTDITEQKMVESQLREAYERTRDLTARLEAAEESERKRIARELHDEFGQMLTGLKFDTAWLNRHLAKEKGVASLQPYLNKLKGMSTLLDQTIQSVRRIATSLRPTILDDLGLIPALEWQAQEFQGRTGVQCQVTTASDMTNTVLEGERATALFRITQELLTNVMRHAEASKVNLDLRQKDNFVILSIQDNGRGISELEIGHGTSLGLLGIKERIAPFGGKLQIRGESGKGTRATVFIPLS